MCKVCEQLTQKENIVNLGVKKLDFGVLGDENELILELVPYYGADSDFYANLCTGIKSPQHNFPYFSIKIQYCPFCGEKISHK